MSPPNILVIFCDQLRRQALGIYGDPNVSTPHIDALARSGVRFSRACSTFPICVPFRFSLMTGEYAHTRFVPSIEWRMSPAERTLADEFNDAGYDTIYCGKWHLHGGCAILPHHTSRKSNLTRIPPQFQGRWKKWLGFELANNPFDTYYFEDDQKTPRPLGKYQTDGLFDLTMNHLEKRQDKEIPFFCILSVEPPHFPLDAPQDFLDRWKDKEVQLPPNFLFADKYPTPGDAKLGETDREEAIRKLRIYYAMIENLDANVGRMMSFLKERGLRDNTIVVFFSDHGQMDAAHSVRSVMKAHPYEESIGIPLIVSDPRMPLPKKAVIDDPVATEDLFPSLLGLAGLSPKNKLPGMNLAPLARGEQSSLLREGVLLEFVHSLGRGNGYHEYYWRGFRTKRYKYTVLGNAKEGGKPWQFFDLQEDPYEMNNLVDDPAHRDLMVHHHTLMRDRLIETDDHYVLAPSYDIDGLNLWVDIVPDKSAVSSSP